MSLNSKHKKVIDLWFERGRIRGANIDAYIEVYPTSSRDGASRSFHRLLKSVDVTEYIHKKEAEESEYLKQTKWQPQIMQKAERLARLSAHARGEVEWHGVPLPANPMAQLKALEILEKSDQFYDRLDLDNDPESGKNKNEIDWSKLELDERIQLLSLIQKSQKSE